MRQNKTLNKLGVIFLIVTALLDVTNASEVSNTFDYQLQDACEKIANVVSDLEYVELIHQYDSLDLAVNCDDKNASEAFKAERLINEGE